MSLSSALSIALSGLQVATSQLSLASNNIANASETGYTVKTANVSSVSLGSSEGGASITGYVRSTNSALTTSLNNSTSESSYSGTQNSYMEQIQSILGSTSSNPALSTALSNFQSAWTQYAAAPESSAQQSAVLQAATTLASTITTISSNVLSLQKQVTSDTASSVTALNTDLAKVATINNQIANAEASDQPTGDLEDARDQAVLAVSQLTSVTVVPRSNGQIALYTPGGTLLLDGQNAQTLTYDGTNITSSSGQNVTNALTGGSIQAQVQFNANSSPASASTAPGSEVIRKLNEQLAALTSAFTSTSSPGSSSTSSTTPSAFAAAYDATDPAADTGSQATNFFTVSYDSNGNAIPSTLAVNPSLLNGTTTIRQTNANAIAASFSSTADYTAAGLSAKGVTYAQLGTSILSNFQQAANTISSSNDTAQQQTTYYQQALTSATGVNVDSELVQLTALQNSYAASAHVITTIQAMLTSLEAAVGAT